MFHKKYYLGLKKNDGALLNRSVLFFSEKNVYSIKLILLCSVFKLFENFYSLYFQMYFSWGKKSKNLYVRYKQKNKTTKGKSNFSIHFWLHLQRKMKEVFTFFFSWKRRNISHRPSDLSSEQKFLKHYIIIFHFFKYLQRKEKSIFERNVDLTKEKKYILLQKLC